MQATDMEDKPMSKTIHTNLKILILSIFFIALFISNSTAQHEDSTAIGHTVVETASDEYAEQASHGINLGEELALWWAIPFAGILLSIALFPLIAPHFWHHHFPKISAAWALIFAIPFVIFYGGHAWYEIFHIYLLDYMYL